MIEIPSLLFYALGLTLLMLGSAFFSGSETALSALTRSQAQRMRRERERSSAAIVRFLDDPRRLFITVLFGNTLVNMAFISITGSLIYVRLFQGKNPGAALLTAMIMQTLFLLVLGEITPKSIAIKNPERFSRAVVGPLQAFSSLIFPFRKVLRLLTDLLLPLFGVKSSGKAEPITSDEIREIILSSRELGTLAREEGEIIANILELPDIKAREIMVARTEMACVEVASSVRDALRIAWETGKSRLPVYRNEIDNICGIFYVKDLPRWKDIRTEPLGGRPVEDLTLDEFLTHAPLLAEANPGNAGTLVREPLFVYLTVKIGGLLRELTNSGQRMAILLDEYGGVSGLVTVQDIVEEVLGEIFDDKGDLIDASFPPDPDHPDAMLIPGDVSVRSVNRRLKLRLDTGKADTLGGYVIHLFGALPRPGDRVEDESGSTVFEVESMDGRRIERVRVHIIKRRRERKPGIWLLPLSTFPLFSAAATTAPAAGSVSPVSPASAVIFGLTMALALLLMAFYNGSETAVVSASRARIDALVRGGNHRAGFIQNLLDAPDQMLGTVLVGTNLMATAAGVAGLRLIQFIIPGRVGIQTLVNTFVMTLVILIFCEILPKTAFRARADALALRSASALRVSAVLLRPIVKLLLFVTDRMARFAREEFSDESRRIMREEFRLIAQMGESEGALEKDQFRMIHSVLDLERRAIEKIMTPLVQIVAVPEDTRIADFYRTVAEFGLTRIPVYKDRFDHFVGVVHILDVLYSEKSSETIKPFVRRDIRLEPQSKRVYALLREMKHSRNPLVFVVDEFGGVVGIVTREDLIEEVMGDIRDERDESAGFACKRMGDRVFECEAQAEIYALNHHFDLDVPPGDYTTVAGWVLSLMERIPKKGETVETDGFKVTVLDADPRRILKVRILKK